MSLSLTFACLWLVAANLIALLPSRDNHWTWAYVLISIGLPILAYVFYQHGPWVALVVMVAAMSLLRWPVLYLWRWLRRQVG